MNTTVLLIYTPIALALSLALIWGGQRLSDGDVSLVRRGTANAMFALGVALNLSVILPAIMFVTWAIPTGYDWLF